VAPVAETDLGMMEQPGTSWLDVLLATDEYRQYSTE
jgi:hypothetical protein